MWPELPLYVLVLEPYSPEMLTRIDKSLPVSAFSKTFTIHRNSAPKGLQDFLDTDPSNVIVWRKADG